MAGLERFLPVPNAMASRADFFQCHSHRIKHKTTGSLNQGNNSHEFVRSIDWQCLKLTTSLESDQNTCLERYCWCTRLLRRICADLDRIFGNRYWRHCLGSFLKRNDTRLPNLPNQAIRAAEGGYGPS